LDYLSNLTDPQRSTQKALEEAGYIKTDEKSFKNLGSVYEYLPPEPK